MTYPKYRVNCKVGSIEMSIPCYSEIDAIKAIQEYGCERLTIEQYSDFTVKLHNGMTRLQLNKISKDQLIKNLIAATFK